MSKITVNQHTPFNNIEVTKLNPATASPVPSSNVTLNVTLGSAGAAESASAAALSAQSSSVSAQSAAVSAAYYAALAANSANSSSSADAAYTNSIAWVQGRGYANTTQLSTGTATAYSNAVAYVAGQSYANTSQVTANSSAAYSNAISYVTAQSYANTTQVTSNAAAAYSNAVSYVSGLSLVNTSQLSSNLSNYALLSGATFTGNIVANNANTLLDLNVGRNLFVTGNLTIGSNVNVIGANNLSIIDNMIYLNSNSTWANPDIGFAANYNDGTYHHTGFFRDHVTGTWKVFDNYLPEPDASIYIDQTNSTFHIANFQANQIFVGNNTSYSTINNTSFNGTANNTSNFNGQAASFYVSNSALSSYSFANTTQVTSNAATAYSNAVSYVTDQAYVNSAQLSTNLSNYQTTAGLAANVAKLASNSSAFLIQPIRVVNANSSIVAADGLILANSTVTLTLPAANSVNGASYEIKNINTGTVTIVGSGADTIDGYANMIISFQNSMLGVQSIGSGWIVF